MGDFHIFSSKPDTAGCGDKHSEAAAKKKVEGRKALRKKLNVVAKHNENLEVTLTTKNTEISELKKAVQSLNDVINSVPIDELKNGSSIASSKILELSKKNRILKSELESAKNKNTKLEGKIQKLECDLKTSTSKKDILDLTQRKSKNPLTSTVDGLQDQLNLTKQKLFESLNQNAELRNSLKLAQKCIQQEIGENMNLNLLAAANTNWRGRAQHIIQLQGKIKELNEKLDAVYNHTEDPTRFAIKKLESTRRAEIHDLHLHIQSLNDVIDDQKMKISALKLRNKHLMDETSNYKLRTIDLVEQTGATDSSLSNMHEQMSVQKCQYENRIQEVITELEHVQKCREDCEVNNEQLRLKINALMATIESKDELIAELTENIGRLESDLKSVCGDFLFSCRDLKKDEFLAILDSLEVEKKSLLNQNTTNMERLEAERVRTSTLSETISKQKIKISRLEGKIRDYQKEQDIQNEKHKRNQRVTEYANNLNTGRLSSIIFENSSSTFLDTMSQQQPEMETNISLEMEELRNKLELANEKINFLEDKLNYTSAEQQNDANIFKDIIANSRNTLLDTIHQIKTADPFDADISTVDLN